MSNNHINKKSTGTNNPSTDKIILNDKPENNKNNKTNSSTLITKHKKQIM